MIAVINYTLIHFINVYNYTYFGGSSTSNPSDSPLLTSASVLLKLRKILKLKYKNISYLTYVNFTLKHLGSSVK